MDRVDGRILMYADDVKLFREIRTVEDCHLLQRDLSGVFEWCMDNKLYLNIDKCKVMSFTRNTSRLITHTYVLDGVPLGSCSTFRDLGVLFDAELSFAPHIDQTCNSALRMLGFIVRNSGSVADVSCLRSLYFTFVRSKLEYASLIWGPIYKRHSLQLQRVERRFLKYLYFRQHGVFPDRGFEDRLLLDEFGMDSLESRRCRASLVFLYKLFNGSTDCSELLGEFSILVPRLSSRGCGFFRLPAAATNAIVRSPVFVMSRAFNDVCHRTDLSSPSLGIFLRNLQVA